MLRVCADTNIILSGLFFDKLPEKLLLLGVNNQIKLILPKLVIEEVDEKILGKFKDYSNLGPAKDFWLVLKKAFCETDSDIISEKEKDVDCIDPDDAKILGRVSQIKPDYFISGNTKHMFTIKNPPVKIVRLYDFLKQEFPDQIVGE